jgi:DNA transposition AAA+ family ATPase
LSVRRAYIGSDVKCKNCGHKFPLAAPADAHSKPLEDRKHEELLDENGWLMAVYGPPKPRQDQPEIEPGRLAPAQDELNEQLGPITSELNAIRTSSAEQLPGPGAKRSSRADRIATVCPGCQATLRVRRAYIGSDVECKHCGHIFPIAAPADSQSEAIEDSKHKQLLDDHGRLMAEHGQLQAKYDQLDAENGRLTTAQNQLTLQLSRVTDELNATRAELSLLAPEGVRSLAEQREWLRTEVERLEKEHRSTHELCKQFQDRELELTEAQKRLEATSQSMLDAERIEKAALARQLGELLADAAQRARLAEELITANSRQVEERSAADAELKALSANLDLLAGQLKEREAALEASSTKLDLLAGQLKEREIGLHTARAECSRSAREQQTAADELKALQMTLAGRDSALRDQSEELGAQVESYRRALEHAENVHKDMTTSLEAKLAAQAERLSMLQEEHRATHELCKQFQDRELELTEAQKRLETTSQSMLDAERIEKAALARQLDELLADAAQRARLAEELIAANSRQVEERSAADAELNALRANLDLVAGQLKEREIDLHTARAECSRLACEKQTSADELKALQMTLAGRDSALRDQSEELGAQVESYRRALEHAEHVHKEITTCLEAKLAAQAEQLSMLQEEHRSTHELRTQFQDRELELTEAQKRLETTSQSMLDAERVEKAALARQLDELLADAAQRARLAEELIAANSRQVEERSAADAELKATLAQIRELSRLLSESERLGRETAAVLNESGVRFHAPVSN